VSERTPQAPFVGRRYLRLEDPPLLRGEARFVADLHPPRMLEAWLSS
jgi:CO/xanthine dehydrogenase Mo-binding subunit